MNQRKLRILVVEDESAIRTGLLDVFTFHGYQAEGAADGREGLRLALGGTFDLVVLDVMLPGVSGFEILERLRERDRDQPVIMLTARSADEDVIQGLSLGADDYVAKPFSVAQLVLRVQAVLRRSGAGSEVDHHLRLGSGEQRTDVDVRNLSATRNGETISFTRREMAVLSYLRENSERPVSREELLARVWGYARDLDIETRTVDIHIAKLRRKIEPDPSSPRYLVTIRGAGYRLNLS
ncbi:MAG: response regulator transcription factor [Gammaproteobacteria bacterium]|nr:response regulator transcription factor [Gammaproteobacteria bacterium]